MDRKALVSVIVMTYNHEKTVIRALESILCQKTTFPFEILIGDDCSTDGTRAILLEYEKHYPDIIRLFFHPQNLGTTKNSWVLMTHASGKYLAACEGDDYWCCEEKLAIQVDFLENNPRYIGCAHDVRLVDDSGQALPCQYLPWISSRRDYSLRDFRGIFLPGHSSTLLRRNLFLDPAYDYSILWKANRWIGDRTSNLFYSAQGDFYRMKRVMSCYRQDSGHRKSTLTSRIYSSRSAIRLEYEYTCRLEEYAYSTLHVEAGFAYHKAELLLTAAKQGFLCSDRVLRTQAKTIFRDLRRDDRWPLLLCAAAANKVRTKTINYCSGRFRMGTGARRNHEN